MESNGVTAADPLAARPQPQPQPQPGPVWRQALVPLLAAFFIAFWLSYEYRELIDDVSYKPILQNTVAYFSSPWSRTLHHSLLFVQGLFFERSMAKAMMVSMLLHLALGAVAWRALVPRLGEAARPAAQLGIAAFLVHPVSLQTVVHVAQRAEILGSLGALVAAVAFLAANEAYAASAAPAASPRGAPAQASSSAPWNRPAEGAATPRRRRAFVALLGLAALCTVFAKESYVPVVALFLLVWLAQRGMLRRAALLIALPLALAVAVAASTSEFSSRDVHDPSRYLRSRAFFAAVRDGQALSPEQSVFLPIRPPLENAALQVALVPLLARFVLAPFAVVDEVGQFPYGKAVDPPRSVFLALGLMLLFALTALAWWRRRSFELAEWALVLSPLAAYAVFVVVPVYDPLMLYRLYGPALFFFVLTLPLVCARFVMASRPSWRRVGQTLPGALFVLVFLAGSARAVEMRTKVTQSTAELARAPENYRVYRKHVLGLVTSGVRPVDCRALLEPALALAPSAAPVYAAWAFCLREQGDLAGAKDKARQVLRYEASAEDVSFALGYILDGGLVNFAPGEVHPHNLRFMGAAPDNDGQVEPPAAPDRWPTTH